MQCLIRPQCFTFPHKDDSRAELFHAKEKTVSHLVQIVQVHTYSNVKIVHHGFDFNWPINCQWPYFYFFYSRQGSVIRFKLLHRMAHCTVGEGVLMAEFSILDICSMIYCKVSVSRAFLLYKAAKKVPTKKLVWGIAPSIDGKCFPIVLTKA